MSACSSSSVSRPANVGMRDRNPAAVVVDGFRIASAQVRFVHNPHAGSSTGLPKRPRRTGPTPGRVGLMSAAEACDGRLGEAYADVDQNSESDEQHVQRHD